MLPLSRFHACARSHHAASVLTDSAVSAMNKATPAAVVSHEKKSPSKKYGHYDGLRFDRIAAIATHPTDTATSTSTNTSPIGMSFSF
jgi:hypothetical protein